MTKRNPGLERHERDAYDTPAKAVWPLLPHLGRPMRFVEPCVGNECLVRHLSAAGHECVASFDLPIDAREHRYRTEGASFFITNPPWLRAVLHPIIVNLSDQLPTWLLLDFDWLATQQAAPFLPRLRKIVAIGRVRWIAGSAYDGFDNAIWALFSHPSDCPPVFIGRMPRAGA